VLTDYFGADQQVKILILQGVRQCCIYYLNPALLKKYGIFKQSF